MGQNPDLFVILPQGFQAIGKLIYFHAHILQLTGLFFRLRSQPGQFRPVALDAGIIINDKQSDQNNDDGANENITDGNLRNGYFFDPALPVGNNHKCKKIIGHCFFPAKFIMRLSIKCHSDALCYHRKIFKVKHNFVCCYYLIFL